MGITREGDVTVYVCPKCGRKEPVIGSHEVPRMTVARAEEIAIGAHHDQFDKQGAPYIRHVLRVRDLVRAAGGDEGAQIVALLHDVVEDTELSLQELMDLGLDQDLALDVDAVTKRKGESKVDAALRAAVRPRSRLVKLMDNMDNTHPQRVLNLHRTEPLTMDRLAGQYADVREVLTGSLLP